MSGREQTKIEDLPQPQAELNDEAADAAKGGVSSGIRTKTDPYGTPQMTPTMAGTSPDQAGAGSVSDPSK